MPCRRSSRRSAVVIGQRAVVHQALVQPGGEGMRALGGHRGFRSPCACGRCRGCRACRQPEAPRHLAAAPPPCRAPCAAGADHAHRGAVAGGQQRLDLLRGGLGEQQGVRAVHIQRPVRQVGRHGLPIGRAARVQGRACVPPAAPGAGRSPRRRCPAPARPAGRASRPDACRDARRPRTACSRGRRYRTWAGQLGSPARRAHGRLRTLGAQRVCIDHIERNREAAPMDIWSTRRPADMDTCAHCRRARGGVGSHTTP